MSYILGLDIGITSVGWAVLDVNKVCEPYKINRMGVRIFESAEQPKTGAALALPRREARGARRRNRRRRHRLERIKRLIERQGIVGRTELENLYNGVQLIDIYTIRYEALDRELNQEEFARLLLHLAQRRGFKSNRKKQSAKEDGKLLEAVKENKQMLEGKGYRTVGEMLYKDEQFTYHKRNTTDDYLCTVSRDMMAEEVAYIFESQRKLGNSYATQEFEKDYLDIYLSQRSFDEGPGGESPYRNPIEKMVGYCTFEKTQKRASKASFSFEYFVLLTQINNIRINSELLGTRSLAPKEREILIELAYKKTPLKYSDVRKALNLREDERFKAIYIGNKVRDDVESKTIFAKMEAYHIIRKALDHIQKNYIKKLPIEVLDQIAYGLTIYKTDDKIQDYLRQYQIEEKVIDALLGISFSKFGHLSLVVLQKMIPYLEEGMTYDEACEWAGYSFNQVELPETKKEFIDSITNPVVRRAVSQSIKVVEAIVREYGDPAKIHIELARDMGRNFQDRKKMEKAQGDNRTVNEKLMREIEETFGYKANGQMLLKYKLWKEQDGRCIYCGEYIEPTRLFTDPTLTDIDHIIPYSKSFDDSYNNKVLVLSGENRQKTNMTPYEYFCNRPQLLKEFEERVKVCIRNPRKQQNLLKKHIDEEDERSFKERNLNDTRYITKSVSHYLKHKMRFDEKFDIKKRVVDVNGSVTAYCRKRWGLTKIREDGDLHHALDAVVIACITDGMIQKVTKYHQVKEEELLKNGPFPKPWEWFREEVEARLQPDPNIMIGNCHMPTYEGESVEPIFVSRMPRRKNSGPAHLETLKGAKHQEEGYTISRVPLTKLKLDQEGEIEGYYNKEANPELYEALKERLLQHKGEAEEAFKEPFYKPQKETAPPIQVKKVRIQEKATLTVPLNEGQAVAGNGSMVRIDIFTKQNKYFVVPIYVTDVVSGQLPSKVIAPKKRYDEWVKIDENFSFLFSLYPNELIYLKHKQSIKMVKKDKTYIQKKEGFVYYKGMDINSAGIKIETHDSQYEGRGIGIMSLLNFEKYQVDILGKISKVKTEKRLAYR